MILESVCLVQTQSELADEDEQPLEGAVGPDPSQPTESKTDLTGLPEFPKIEYPEDAYHMVTQVQWEDDIIWNSEEVKQKIMAVHRQRGAVAGWIPTATSRTAYQYQQQSRNSIY